LNISRPFIERPIATSLVMIALLAFGIMAYLRLPVSPLPDVDFPTIQVSATLPGASAETIAASVATPLENEFSAIDGLDSMSSQSSLGATNITLQFDLARDLDTAAQDVQSAISRALPRLPRDMNTPPSYRKVNPADQAILILSVSSSTLPLYVVNEYAETRLAQSISTVRGVAQVQVFGPQKYAVRIQADPERLAARDIGLDEVAAAIQEANVNLPTGTLYSGSKAFTIEANGQLDEAAGYRPITVAYRNGAPIRISDIGRVLDSVENDKTAAWRGNPQSIERAVVLGIRKQPGANTVEVAQAVLGLLPRFREEIPPAIDVEILFDRSLTVKEAVHDVELTLLLTLILVVVVIFVFLRRLSATAIPSLSLPLAILATFAVMYLCGFSLNNLSLMALTLSVGFVVDDSIVVLENIVRHMEQGKSPFQAALDGSREIGFTVVSMTISLAAVFIPFLFMGGIVGNLFREFSVTIAVAILVSGVVSLTLTPMLTARMRPPSERKAPGRLSRAIERGFDRVLAYYSRTLGWTLRRRRWTLMVTAATLGATLWLFQTIPKGFFPTEDVDQLFVEGEAVQGISYDQVVEQQQKVARIVQADPDVAAFMSTVGARGSRGGSNLGNMHVRLTPRAERERSAEQVANDLRKRLAEVPGMQTFVRLPPPIRIGGRLTKSEYQLTLQSNDTDALYTAAPALEAELKKSPLFVDVTSDLQLENPTLQVNIDRDRAARLGLSAARIEDALYSAYGSRQVSTILASNASYQVILELDPRSQTDESALDRLYLRSTNGSLVPMSSVASLEQAVGPLTVTHSGQLPAVTVSFNVAQGHSLGAAVEEAERTARRVLPDSISTQFQGAAEAFQSSFQGLGLLLLVSIFVIYLVLGILYESLTHPLTILSALPFAGLGALLTLMLMDIDLNVYSFVGIILLVGLVKKNGIMMVDVAIEERKRGVNAQEAITHACLVRFRPIMMTTMAALFGTLPIALGIGAGAESRQPLGVAVVGGLLFSQLLTLYVTPVLFLYLERLSEWVAERRHQKTPRTAEPAIAE
jgi:hydrophobic/amphiphilic exporter-1 (mainly G- bacteria), HAE1 family